MARHRRLGPKEIPQHVIQRGNNRKQCFTSNQDFAAYVHWLKMYSEKYAVRIHAWVLMTNHVHILCTPALENKGVSLMMQSLGREYVRYFNTSYNRTGTLWEGRFKSCLVQATDYLLNVYRYIELNPVRAKMVTDPADYKWSSYRINALGVESDLCHPHELYIALGNHKHERLQTYQLLFNEQLSSKLVSEIRKCSHKELVLGNNDFTTNMEALLERKLKRQTLGRPKKLNCT